eukprot:7380697-Prymnesium_polylepis.1
MDLIVRAPELEPTRGRVKVTQNLRRPLRNDHLWGKDQHQPAAACRRRERARDGRQHRERLAATGSIAQHQALGRLIGSSSAVSVVKHQIQHQRRDAAHVARLPVEQGDLRAAPRRLQAGRGEGQRAAEPAASTARRGERRGRALHRDRVQEVLGQAVQRGSHRRVRPVPHELGRAHLGEKQLLDGGGGGGGHIAWWSVGEAAAI